MSTSNYSPIDVITINGVTVERHEPDFNDLAWQTFMFLTNGLELDNPGEDEVIARYFTTVLSKPRLFPLGTVYANPCAVVRSKHGTDQFLRIARRFQKEWFHCFNEALCSAERVRRQMNLVDRIVRQLIYTGVMVIDGRHIFPDRWPGKPPIIPGTCFGSLVVLESLPGQRVRCQCGCGNVVVKLRKHLVSEQTKSCGCRQAAREARLKNRRRDRGWKHTGEITS